MKFYFDAHFFCFESEIPFLEQLVPSYQSLSNFCSPGFALQPRRNF